MKITLRSNGFFNHGALLEKHLKKRIPVELCEDGLLVELAVNKALGKAESYEITPVDGGYTITGADEAGLYYGIGKFLHSAQWTETAFVPDPPKGVVTPACSFRATYFAVHFYNWYQQASTEDLEDYLEEMLLWGYSTIIGIVPVVNLSTLEEPFFFSSVNKVKRVFALCRKLGMKTGLIVTINVGLKAAPEALSASQELFRSRTRHRMICTSKPEGLAYMRELWTDLLGSFQDVGLDYLVTWPYDEGGCTCKDCRTWGANGYVKACNAFGETAKQLYPNAQFIISTWLFDTEFYGAQYGEESEFEGFYRHLKTELAWVDYIMVDGHGEKPYPQYPLEHEVVKPVINFPEISMYGLYPWGGFGANPLPKHFQRIWDSSKHILQGGLPYSEGIYEDILKVQFSGYYWTPEKNYREILSEYINYEYSSEVCEEVLLLMELIEENHILVATNCQPRLKPALMAKTLADTVNAKLSERAKGAWRWRILYIRAQLDVKRYRYYFDHKMSSQRDLVKLRSRSAILLKDDPEAQEMFRELCQCYCCVDYNTENRWTHPPVNGGDPSDTFENMKGIIND